MKTRIEKLEMQGFKSFAKKTAILFPSDFSIVCGPNGSGKSAKWDTEVILSDGTIRPLGEIVDTTLNQCKNKLKMDDGVYTLENPEGLKTWGLDPNSMKVVEKNISAFIKRKGEPYLYEIKTRTGKRVTTTGCHPVMIYKNGEVRSEVVNALKKGELIATPNKLDLPERKFRLEISGIPWTLSPEFARFLGYMVSDGHIKVQGNCRRCDFVNADKELIRDFVFISKNLGYKPILHNYDYRGKATLVCLNSRMLVKSLATLFNQRYKGKNKHIPKEILFSQKYILANFLAALFDCDASIRKDNPTLEYVTNSPKLADQVQLSLLRFGIVARKKAKMKYATNTKNKTRRKYYHIVIEGKEKLKAFYEAIPLRCEHKKKRLRMWANKNIITNPNLDVLPQDVNILIKECRHLLGIEYKSLRKKYPRFAAYNENRCCPTREGIEEAFSIFRAHIEDIKSLKKNLKKDKKLLLKFMRKLKIKRSDASIAIGLHPDTINSNWAHGKYGPKPENLEKLFKFVKSQIEEKLSESKKIMKTLQLLANSDIFWDKIEKIEKVKGEKWVYDLTIPNCHNFIGNGIFVHNSNILDAICFVLGRTSAKSLRAKKMLGMIFNGGKGKKPAEFAKVKIYFSNKDRVFPIEEDVISVSRKVNRRGVSIYKLNGKTVTREKILEVLRAGNIRPDGHNIILQGDVTEVIEMGPIERREIIDEISGISEFEEKRHKAQRELLTVEERLKESSIILNEKETQLKKLEVERIAAEEYSKYANDLDKLRASLATRKLNEAEKAMQKLDNKIRKKDEDFGKFSTQVEKIESQLDKDEKSIERIRQRLFDRTKDVEIIKKVEQLRAQIYNRENKIEGNRMSIERYRDMIQKLRAVEEKQRQLAMSRAVQEVLKLKHPDVFGTVGSLSKVPSKYSTAIAVAAGHHMQDLVVSDSSTAVECIKHLKKNKIGRATFLPLDRIKERDNSRLKKYLKEKGAVDFAINLVDFDKKYWHAFSHVFGDTLVVNNIDTAKRIGFGKLRMVTLDGDLVERGGAVIGGFFRKEKPVFTQTGEIRRYEQNIKAIEEDNRVLAEETDKLKKELERMLSKEKAGSEEIRKAEEKKQKTEQQLRDLRERRRSLNEKKLTAHEELNRLKINRARLEAQLENLKQEFGETRKFKEEELYDLAVSTLQAKIRDALTKINSLGPINQKAVEEHKQLKKVYDDLKDKVDKLTSERDKVLQVIAEIEGRRKETFLETMNAVSEQFKLIFHDLVGGEGSLRLEGEVLEDSGLIIEASPPGRKVLNIDAMSGGEKTLTALAFLFAIQKFRPAPFYVLDEIDAALDKVNTLKITDFLRKHSEMAQFVVITHNDTTIQAADCVYGVSMEAGESKLVGIRMP